MFGSQQDFTNQNKSRFVPENLTENESRGKDCRGKPGPRGADQLGFYLFSYQWIWERTWNESLPAAQINQSEICLSLYIYIFMSFSYHILAKSTDQWVIAFYGFGETEGSICHLPKSWLRNSHLW